LDSSYSVAVDQDQRVEELLVDDQIRFVEVLDRDTLS
jgi:hypothetical protein